MNTTSFSNAVNFLGFASILGFGANLRATTSPREQALSVSIAGENEL
jgi:hypothetical protein